MSNTAFALRWVGGLLVAVLTYVAVFLAGSQVWKYLGLEPGKVLFWSAALAAALAMIAAAHVVARESWTAVAWIVLLLSAAPPLVIIFAASSVGFWWLGVDLLCGLLAGGLLAFMQLYRMFRVPKVSGPD